MKDKELARSISTRCQCPIYCKYCGMKRTRTVNGHICSTKRCPWEKGYPDCALYTEKK